MGKVKIQMPSPELQEKMDRAVRAVRNQNKRVYKCPYCKHNTITVFADARGHIQNKCTYCKQEVVVDLVNMRCHRGLSPYTIRKKK